MQKVAQIVGHQSWKNLTGKYINNKCVEIRDCGDIHPYRNGPIFKGTETLFMNSCDKNFVYYWLNNQTFPNVKTIYLSSHPCEYPVMRRFPQSQIYLNDWYQRYKTRWADDLTNVNVMKGDEINGKLLEMSAEDLITSERKDLDCL